MVSAPRCPPGARGLLTLLLLLPLPGARAIPCLPPPDITHGSHTGQSEQEFSFGSAVTYKCDQGFSLIGEASIHCTTKDHVNGEWSGPAPECKGQCGTPPTLSRAVPRDTSHTEGFPIGTEVTYRCLDGFVKIPGKSDTVVCLSNSEWSTIGEFCNGGCGATPRLKSAALSAEDAKKNYCPPGTTVSYVCRPGYERTELRPVITCLENSTWSEAPEFCRGKSCGVPKGPEHGRAVNTTNYLYGAKVNIICDEGDHVGTYSRNDPTGSLTGRKNPFSKVLDYYRSNWRVKFRLRGRPFIQCLLKGGDQVEWSQRPTCEGQCGTPPTLSRAVPRDTSHTEGFPIGTEVTYRCLDGFVKIPGKSDTVVCLSNSEWSTIGEFCNGGCGATPRLKSAALSAEDAKKNYCPPGTTVSYVCRQGYEETELRPVITCLENSTWSEAPEFCRRKSCGVPKGPEHGRAINTTNYLYGAKVNIICDEGFRLRGRPFIQCLLKGEQLEWSQLPTCQAIPCLPPPDITHGSHTGQSEQEFSFGSAVTYKCDQGFSLIGEASIHCTTKDHVNGEWSGPAPECKGQCGAPPTLSRAVPRDTSHTEGFPIGTEVTYRCLDGFVKIPGKSDTVVCLSNSEWSTIGEFCNGGCGATPRLKSAALSAEDAKKNYCPPGTTVSYVCRPGYEETELRPVITCLENSTWSEAPEFCRRKSCGVPKGPEHGRAVNTTNYLYGAKVNIICDEGDHVGTYSRNDPTGSLTGRKNPFSKVLDYYRSNWRVKFRLRGRPFIQCLLKGGDQVEWSQLPTCQAISCLPPPDITHGSRTGQSEQEFSFGSAVTYKCDQGFSRIGEASIHCTTKDHVNGEWSGPAPECKAITCSPPPNIANGIHNGSNVEIFDCNSSVTYKCDHNFSLTGEASIHCTTKDNINGVWNGSAPECKGLCGSLPTFSRAFPRDTNHTEGFPIGTEVTYRCHDGFAKIPGKSDTVVCLSNSEWSTIEEFCGRQCGSSQRRRRDVPPDTNGREGPDSCGGGSVKNLGKSDTLVCLSNSEWSTNGEFCGRPGIDTHFGIPGIAIVIVVIAIVIAGIAIGTFAALNKKWQKKKGSYGVNLDSRKHHITTEHDLEMSETKSNLISKV